MVFTCRNCGITSGVEEDLCSPAFDRPEAPFCGIPEEWICRSNILVMRYLCKTCGSYSAEPAHLCRPERLNVQHSSTR